MAHFFNSEEYTDFIELFLDIIERCIFIFPVEFGLFYICKYLKHFLFAMC
jgi:hypothetical protein